VHSSGHELGEGYRPYSGEGRMPAAIGAARTATRSPKKDVAPELDPLPGSEPYMEYWVYAECVR
jgi:hypothetical protein